MSRDEWALELAKLCAQRSTCLRRAVGCVLVNARGHVLATGYNGVASGMPHCNHEVVVDPEQVDIRGAVLYGSSMMRITTQGIAQWPNACPGAAAASGTNLDGCQAIHAEQNALLQCRDPYQIETCYCTTAPCITCTKLLMNTSCTRIIFLEEYPHSDAASKLWKQKPDRVWGWFNNGAIDL